ncbi:MAG: hypothetical protein R6V53_07275 [Candidatus Woesearchaeota archaeon]
MNENELEELKEEAKDISGTCCKRHSARGFFRYHAEDMSNEELIKLYYIVREPMHDYCRKTNSSTTRSNVSIISDVMDASLELIVESEEPSEALTQYKRLISDYEMNADEAYTEKNLTKKIKAIESLEQKGAYETALGLLTTLNHEPEEEFYVPIFEELKTNMYERLIKGTIKQISENAEISYSERLRKISRALLNTPEEYVPAAVMHKARDLLTRTETRPQAEMTNHILTKYSGEGRELKKNVRLIRERLESKRNEYSAQKELLDEEREVLEETLKGRGKLRLLGAFRQLFPGTDQYAQICKKISVYERKLETLQNFYEKKKSMLSETETTLVNKVIDRTLTRDEYNKIF